MTQPLTIRRAAELLDVSESTIRQLIRDGSLPHVKIRRCTRLLLADVEALVRKQRRKGR